MHQKSTLGILSRIGAKVNRILYYYIIADQNVCEMERKQMQCPRKTAGTHSKFESFELF